MNILDVGLLKPEFPCKGQTNKLTILKTNTAVLLEASWFWYYFNFNTNWSNLKFILFPQLVKSSFHTYQHRLTAITLICHCYLHNEKNTLLQPYNSKHNVNHATTYHWHSQFKYYTTCEWTLELCKCNHHHSKGTVPPSFQCTEQAMLWSHYYLTPMTKTQLKAITLSMSTNRCVASFLLLPEKWWRSLLC